jgi:uncharacterized protein YegP (UPF0339 family)
MAAKFEISKYHAGKFRFHLKAPNGEIIVASQAYATKANATKASTRSRNTHPTPRSRTTAKPNPASALAFHCCGPASHPFA